MGLSSSYHPNDPHVSPSVFREDLDVAGSIRTTVSGIEPGLIPSPPHVMPVGHGVRNLHIEKVGPTPMVSPLASLMPGPTVLPPERTKVLWKRPVEFPHEPWYNDTDLSPRFDELIKIL